MKKIINILVIITLLVTMTGCNEKSNVEQKGQKDGYMFAEEYTSINGLENSYGKKYREVKIDEDNPFVYSTAEEIAEKIKNKETFVVYFGYSTCPWCRSMIEQLIKCAKDNNHKVIYYVDVLDIRDKIELDENGEMKTTKEGSKGYMELLELMGDVLADYTLTSEDGEQIKTNEKRIYAPNVVSIVNGNAKEMVEGTSSKLKDPYDELTEEMEKESYNSIKCIFDCLEENVCKKNAC